MAFVLLAIGALMSGAGAYAIIHGYSIIQIEEGWASVISGATLIAGGMVTAGLGLVLRTLTQVKAALVASPVKLPADLAAPASLRPQPAFDFPAATIPTKPDPVRPDSIEPAIPAAAEIHSEPMAPTAPALAPLNIRPANASAEPIVHLAAPDEPATPVRLEPEPVFDAPRPADDYKLETPSTAEHDIPPMAPPAPSSVPAEPASPPMDDWLDRAFAELDRDTPPPPRKAESRKFEPRKFEPHKTERAPDLEPAEATSAPPPSAATASAHPEPEPAPEPSPAAPNASAPPSAVIGRYESDGTLYVMYADGSIEAQSASGVYRFASMAELKAFIEK